MAQVRRDTQHASAALARPAVTRLMLEGFRNYAALDMPLPDAPCVLLTGPNGAGKTNLLEALSLFSPGRGLRRARLADIARQDHGQASCRWTVSARLETDDDGLQLGVAWTAAQSPDETDKRSYIRDGLPLSAAAGLAERLAVVWLTPAMDRLFQDGPSERRRLLDRIVLGLDPAHVGRVAAYEKAMRERARLLRRAAYDGRAADPAWLDSLEIVMAEKGVAIAAARVMAAAALQDRLDAAPPGPFPQAILRLMGQVEEDVARSPAVEAEDRFREALKRARAGDEDGTPGPHRSDFTLVHRGKEQDAVLCSTGEQKALLIALTLAHGRLIKARRAQAPLMLLDEVATHLDEARREALYEQIFDLGGQAWLTGTDAAPFARIIAQSAHYQVEEARPRPA